jgi:low temperature requirement protein LtrA
MTARATDEQHRAASPLELLFDLTFVVAVAQIADQLAIAIENGDGLTRIVPFLMVFFAIWWAWMNFTWFASAYDTDDVPYRLMTLVQMAGVLVLAAGVPAAFTTESYLGITIGYLIMRVGLVSQWIRAAAENPEGRSTARRYAIGVSVIQIGWVARLWLPVDPADQWWSIYLAFVVLVALEVSVPVWAERTGSTTWHPHHIAERYSLFTIILLGETIAALTVGIGGVVGSTRNLVPIVIAAASMLVLIFGLWWLYFMEPSGDGLARHRGLSYYWGYLHYLIFAALGALGAGIEVATASVGPHPAVVPLSAAYVVALPTAIYLAILWAANAPLVTRIVLRAWVVWPVVAVLLAVPLAATELGLDWDVALIALVVAALVAVSIAVKIRTRQAD